MATLITGISTSGLASSPLPHVAWSRAERPGEYNVRLNASTGLKLDLIITAGTLHHLVSHLIEIEDLVATDEAKWRQDPSFLNPNPRSA